VAISIAKRTEIASLPPSQSYGGQVARNDNHQLNNNKSLICHSRAGGNPERQGGLSPPTILQNNTQILCPGQPNVQRSSFGRKKLLKKVFYWRQKGYNFKKELHR